MLRIAVLACFALVACGADGAPTKPGVSVTGEAQIGVSTKR
jgi:hypothetical protein